MSLTGTVITSNKTEKKHKNFAKVKFSVFSSLLWVFISHSFPLNHRLLIY